jgi:cystathionine beta-lyase|tara:strand:+ start:1050 stop:1415 length:366 start_codon:yes stop_codon:yes gene_type:complete
MAELEGADRGFAFSSGMSALMCVTRLVKTGERIVTGDDIYGGTSRLLDQVLPKVGIEVVHVDTNDLRAVERAINGGPTTMVMLCVPGLSQIQAHCSPPLSSALLVPCVDRDVVLCTFTPYF